MNGRAWRSAKTCSCSTNESDSYSPKILNDAESGDGTVGGSRGADIVLRRECISASSWARAFKKNGRLAGSAKR